MSLSARRILSLWLPRLATDRLSRTNDTAPKSAPLATVTQVRDVQRLAALNDAAARRGLAPGMTLADARVRCSALGVTPADPQADWRQLDAVGDWCERYTPLVGRDAPDGLLLDVTGCAHLFGGETAMIRDIVRRMAGFGFCARAAIAATPGAAWALAHYGEEAAVAKADTHKALLDLPLAALRLDKEALAALAEMGLYHIADIAQRPRAPLAARFGEEVLLRLDQALGHDAEAITPRFAPAPYSVEQDFIEPITRRDDVLVTILNLAGRLKKLLEQRGEGVRVLETVLFQVDGQTKHITLGTSRPLRDPAAIHRLFANKFAIAEDHDTGFGFDKIRLSARSASPFESGQSDFAVPDHARECEELVDRLSARLGPEHVLRLIPQNTHIPEYAAPAVSAQRACASMPLPESAQDSLAPHRPLRLLECAEPIKAMAAIPDGPPVRFRWRGVLHRTARSEGPERIAMEWWRDAHGRALTRDYFRVESAEGGRFWLYREGLYVRETARPRWFLHGLLA